MDAEVLDNKYTIEPITSNDRLEVVKCMAEHFFRHEPLNQFMQLDHSADNVWVQGSADCIVENCSFKAVNRNGKIVGLSLNRIVEKDDPSPVDHPAEMSSDEQTLDDFFTYIKTNFDLFDVHPEHHRVLEAQFMCVDGAYRNMGIATTLAERTVQHMQQNGIKLFAVYTTSFYSARVCERLGLNMVFMLPYDEYIVNGETPLIPAKPHDAFRVYTRIM